MKKILLIIPLLLILNGCKKDFDEVVAPEVLSYKITNISKITQFDYTPENTYYTFTVSIIDPGNSSELYCDFRNPDGVVINSEPIILKDTSIANVTDRSLFTKFYFTQDMANGKYQIELYVKDKEGNINKAAIESFVFNNGQTNIPPVIKDLVVSPDDIIATDTVVIKLSVAASDSNGQQDIERVYFTVTKPDGTTTGVPTSLFDDGSAENGDAVAGDGIYSRLISVNQNNAKGTYRFDFQAIDRGKKTSNIISHNIIIR